MSDLETLEKARPSLQPLPAGKGSPVAPDKTASPLPLRERDRVRGNDLDKGGSVRRMCALIRKEMLQIIRDPSSLVVAVVLPLLLLFLFGFGVSFDVTKMRVGVVIENPNPETEMFEASLANTPFFQVRVAHDRRAFLDDLTASRIEGVVILAGDFTQRIGRGVRGRRGASVEASGQRNRRAIGGQVSDDRLQRRGLHLGELVARIGRHRSEHCKPRQRLCARRVADLALSARVKQRLTG